MPQVVCRCPHCAGTFQVEARPKERQIHCSHCRGLVTVAATPAGAPLNPAAAVGQKAAPRTAAPVLRAGRLRAPDEATPDPLLERPTAAKAVAPLTTPIDQLSIHDVLRHGRANGVSDIHVAPGAPLLFRIASQLVPVTPQTLTSKQSARLSLELLNEGQRQQFHKDHDYDFMAIDDYGRYRVNVGYFDGEIGTIIRLLAQRPRTLEELKVPPIIKEFAGATKGLVLFTGSASQGKTTTMTAIIDEINTKHPRHVTPIEYLHVNKKGLVRQRQTGRDTADFHSGLRAALRQNPDVISIGEMRDFETIKIAFTAAETGCLVLSTLHIMSIDKIIERILSFVPTEDEGHIRYVLADTLVAVIHQELVPARDGGKRLACEILVVNQATKNIIRNRGTFFLRNVITTGRKFGMISMQNSLQSLVDEGAITPQTMADVMVNYR